MQPAATIREIASVFPARPLDLKGDNLNEPLHKRIFHALGELFAVLLVLAIGLGMLGIIFGEAPAILHDWRVSRDAEQFVPKSLDHHCEIKFSTSRGRKKKSITCKDVIVYGIPGDHEQCRRQVITYHVDREPQSKDIIALRSASRPELVSTKSAIAQIWSRIGGLILPAAFGSLLLFSILTGIHRSRKIRRKIGALSHFILRPVAVKVVREATHKRVLTTKCLYDEGRSEKHFKVKFHSKQPFRLPSDNSESWVLGLTADQSDFIFLPDAKLERLALSDPERAAIFNARDGAGTQGATRPA